MSFFMVVETRYSPEELLRRIHKFIEYLYRDMKRHASHNAFQKIADDFQITRDQDKTKALSSKFEDSIMRQFYMDAKYLGEVGKRNPAYRPQIITSMKKIEELLKEIKKGQVYEMKKARFLAKMAGHMSHEIGKEVKEIKHLKGNIANQISNMGGMPSEKKKKGLFKWK